MELSLPSGNFDCAIIAFKNGAESVYFGLKDFSARSKAENFDIDDYRRLRQKALTDNKKIYITFNTILNNNEINKAFRLLKIIDFIGVDGLIVQDWGIVNLVKKYFPSIPLHASTQMAIQNSDGVKVLRLFEFKRAVLARELSLDEIKKIRNENKDIELKVFIHGAMCYSVSGLCNASRLMLEDGSANKGTCRQVCRMKFKSNDKKEETPFAMCDLISDKSIIDALKDIKIDSVKVEGRLKGGIYVKWATKYYRSLIDNKPFCEAEEYKDRLQTAFSRIAKTGYFYQKNNENVIVNDYPGHRGIKVADCIGDNKFLFTKSIRPHDGIMLIKSYNGKVDVEKRDAPQKFISPGEIFLIDFKINKATKGDELYKIKDSRDNEEKINKESFPLYRKPVLIDVDLSDNKISLTATVLQYKIEKSYEYRQVESNTLQNLERNFSNIFSRTSNWFCLKEINVKNNSKINHPFVPMSFIKKIAIDFYKSLDVYIENYFSQNVFENTKSNIDSNIKPDIILSPICFDNTAPKRELFYDNIVEINNISQIFNIIDIEERNLNIDNKIRGVILGEYLNIANSQSLNFFISVFKDKLLGYKKSIEIEDCQKYKTKFPLFIHRKQSCAGIINVKIRSADGNSRSS